MEITAMTFSSPSSEQDRRAQIAQRMVAAMGRDVASQRELINARILGDTDAVCRTSSEPEMEELREERRCLREQFQCSLLRINLATQKIQAEITRAKGLCAVVGLNQKVVG